MVTFPIRLLSLFALIICLTGCPTPNNLPIADAGSTQEVALGMTVTLDGTASFDADGDSLIYQWQFTTRPTDSTASLADAGSVRPSFVPDRPGIYRLQLTVLDSLGTSAPATVSITVTGSVIAVPDLTGLTEEIARTTLTDLGLTLGTVTTNSSPTVPEGQIISQTPEATTEVASETAVDVVVSTGPTTATVPNVVGQSRTQAETALIEAGFTVGTVTTMVEEEAEEGTVLSQSVAAGTMVNEGTAIDLVIAAGPPIVVEQRSAFTLRDAIDDAGDNNVAQPDNIAVDATSTRAFITSRLTPYVAIYDTDTAQVTGTLDSGFPLPGDKTPYVSPDGTVLFVVNENTGMLARIQIADDQITASASIGSGFLDMAITGPSNALYIARTTAPALLILDSTTLAELGTSSLFDGTAPTLHIDDTTGNLLVLDTATVADAGVLQVFDTNSNSISQTVNFDMPGTGASRAIGMDYDAVGENYFILGTNGLDMYGGDGARVRAYVPRSSVELIAIKFYAADVTANNRILTLGRSRPANGTVAPRGAQLVAFNPNAGTSFSAIDTLALGEGNSQFSLHPMTGTIVSADSTTGTIWRFGASPFPVSTIPTHLGVTIDEIEVVNGALFGTSRFGGNFLFRVALPENTVTMFEAGRWPTLFRVRERDRAVPTVVVLNAWDSTLQEFSAGTAPTLGTTVSMGFPPGTTARLPDMAIHPNGVVVAVAYPEFGQVELRSIVSGNLVKSIDIPDAIVGDGSDTKGQVQVLFNQGGANVFYVFDRDQRLLHRYDTDDSYAHLGTTDLSAGLVNMDDAPESDWLYYDVGEDRLYVGPLQVDPVTGLASGPALPVGQVIRALDTDRALYWTVNQTATETGFTVVVNAVDQSTNTVADSSLTLASTPTISPEFAFDPENRQFFVAYPATTVIETYGY